MKVFRTFSQLLPFWISDTPMAKARWVLIYIYIYIFTSKYTRKHIRLMSFYKTFTTKDTIASINDSIRLVSKPFIYSIFKLLYYLNFSFQLIYLLPNYEVDRNYQIFHYIYQYQNFLNHRLYSLSRKRNTYPFVF